MSAATLAAQKLTLGEFELELFEDGAGAPLLFLHSGQGFYPGAPYVGALAARRRLIAPSHPGFGRSSLPSWVDSVDDIANLYLELLDHLGLDQVEIIGCSIGGWIAADLATKVPNQVKKLVLVGPVGVKTGSKHALDIPDIYALPPDAVQRLMFHDPAAARMDIAAMSDEELTVIARNRETLTMLVWEPWMHSAKLKHRLHRISCPTLFVRGESDGLVSAEYMARYAALVPGAVSATIARAGHAPQVEQPAAFADTVFNFLKS